MNRESVRRAQDARYVFTLRPTDLSRGAYRITVAKAWWAGPGFGVTRREVVDVTVIVGRYDDEASTVRAALRMLADAL